MYRLRDDLLMTPSERIEAIRQRAELVNKPTDMVQTPSGIEIDIEHGIKASVAHQILLSQDLPWLLSQLDRMREALESLNKRLERVHSVVGKRTADEGQSSNDVEEIWCAVANYKLDSEELLKELGGGDE